MNILQKKFMTQDQLKKKKELIQHFFGINITTKDNSFNESKLTLMKFTKENNYYILYMFFHLVITKL